MRTLVLSLMLVALVPLAVFKPWIGVLGWTWLGTMNPHKLTWGFLFNAPVAAAVGGATLVGLVLTKDKRFPPMTGPTIALLLFIAWMNVTSVFAIHPDLIQVMYSKVMKVQLMIFVSLALLYTRIHLNAFIWVLALSLAFFGVKGGIYTLLTGGQGRVWGPPGGFIEGNNEIALALTMTIPMLHFLRVEATNKWIRMGLLFSMIVTAFAILGSQSRGAFLAISAMAFYLWIRSEHKVRFGIPLVVFAFVLVAFMPETWIERMSSIRNYEQDSSATGRINAWWMAFNLASDRFIGGGFEVITPSLFAKYAPNPSAIHAAHSIYFQVLGEHGFIGLALFMLVWFFTWRTAGWLIANGRAAGMATMARLGAMVQVSLVGYFVGGAFLSLAYFDLPYNLLVACVIARNLVEKEERQRSFVETSVSPQAPETSPLGRATVPGAQAMSGSDRP